MPPMTEPQMPKAMARSRPRKFALRIDWVAGRIVAPPTPCRSRAAMSSSPAGEAGEHRGADEDRQADEVDPPPARDVAHPAERDEERREDERVDGVDPLRRPSSRG